MAKKLKLTTSSTERMYRVRARLKLEKREMLWTLRIAFARSLQIADKQFKLKKINDDNTEGKRFEIEIPTLMQNDHLIFKTLLQQHYCKKIVDEEFDDLLLKHIEHGLLLLDEDTQKFSGFEYLITIAKKGLDLLKPDQKGFLLDKEKIEFIEPGYDDIIKIHIGIEKDTNESYDINFNKTDEHVNNYIGIAGRPGSGKTYFVKYFLKELRKNTNFKTNFIIFDYAKGDIASDNDFLDTTKAQLIRVGERPIPINIFELPDSSYRQKKLAAERIVSIVKNVEANIGKVQEQNLYNAIINAYESVTHDDYPYPDFQMVRNQLELNNDRPDSLTSVFRPLTDHNLFIPRGNETWDSLLNKTIVFDIHKLPALKDLCVFFILNEIYSQLMLLPDSKLNLESKAREMRTVIVIDEAHHFLKIKKRVRILENLIREIRSKGSSVILLSQSPDDYDQPEFNFFELLEFVFFLGSSPSSYRFIQQSFGVSSEQAKKIKNDLTSLKLGEAFTKDINKKFTKILLCK